MKQASTDSNNEKSGDLFYVLTIGHTVHVLDYVESNKKITVTIFTSKSGLNSTFREQGEQGMTTLLLLMKGRHTSSSIFLPFLRNQV